MITAISLVVFAGGILIHFIIFFKIIVSGLINVFNMNRGIHILIRKEHGNCTPTVNNLKTGQTYDTSVLKH